MYVYYVCSFHVNRFLAVVQFVWFFLCDHKPFNAKIAKGLPQRTRRETEELWKCAEGDPSLRLKSGAVQDDNMLGFFKLSTSWESSHPAARMGLVRCRTLPIGRQEVEDAAKMTKVLLIEDSKFLRVTTEEALTRGGYTVITASDGEEALRLARENMPDLILLDMLLPKMPGLEVLRALKSNPATAGIAVVVLSGLSGKNAKRLQQDGAFAFLGKEKLALDGGSKALLQAMKTIVQKLRPTARAVPK
jgi:CheY-like chemotaxis protein